MKTPLIALVGRPNVGKSTLFNVLTKTRQALVSDEAGLTRDRHYGILKFAGKSYRVVDTGGLLREEEEEIDFRVDEQARVAIAEADVIVFLVSAKEGLSITDELIAQELRKSTKPVIVAVNKSDFLDPDIAMSEFYQLGFETMIAISAAHRRGTSKLIERLAATVENLILNTPEPEVELGHFSPPEDENNIFIAVLGRPNVGKSTLVNRLLGENRLIASPVAGTTRDSIFVPYEDKDGKYTLIDTAGIRRKSKVDEKVEKFSIVKALEAVEQANVVILVLDAKAGIAEQDAKLLGEITRRGRRLLIAVNKWDLLNAEEKTAITEELERKLHFIDYAKVFYISALKGSNVKNILPEVKNIWKSALCELSTTELTTLLQSAYAKHHPPLVNGKAIKLQYAHQGGKYPPHIIIHGTRTENIPASYTQYLMNTIRKHFNLLGTPIRISYRDKFNPYKK